MRNSVYDGIHLQQISIADRFVSVRQHDPPSNELVETRRRPAVKLSSRAVVSRRMDKTGTK